MRLDQHNSTTESSMSKDKKSKSKPKFFRPDYAGIVAAVEKKFHLDVGSMSSEAKRAAFMSTGLLSTDLVLGGGILPGAWYTFYGGEGSAKSTHVMHIAQGAVAADIPIIEYSDFEGSLAPDSTRISLFRCRQHFDDLRR
jgi:predicted ATP-dependent serine protease